MFVKLTKGQKLRLRALSKKLDFPVRAMVRTAVNDFLICSNIEYRQGKSKLSSLYGKSVSEHGCDFRYYDGADIVVKRGCDDGQ